MSDSTEDKEKNEKKSGRRGRKPFSGIFNESILVAAEKLSGALLNDQQIADCLEINIHTFYNWRNEHESFAKALIKGRSERLNKLATLAVEKAESDNNMLTFMLKSKGKFIEHQHVENIAVKKGELALKEKMFQLSSEKFISELCETHNLNKDETLELLKKHIGEPVKKEEN